MRDERGRYHSLKAIMDNGPAWAKGCPSCTHGIVRAPELTGATALYLERLVQAVDGDVVFCTCQAGTRYRVALLNCRQQIIEQQRRDLRTTVVVRIESLLEIARTAIHAAQAQNVPTVHG